MNIPVANSELLDKLTILEIKHSHGLTVDQELGKLSALAAAVLTEPGIASLYQVLKTINAELWQIEDYKRACEKTSDFGQAFVTHARLVYMLNDERARIKRLIDRLTGSEITEYKSHED